MNPLLWIILFLLAFFSPQTAPPEELRSAAPTLVEYRVVKVVDGDTIHVEREGLRDKVRLIGIDTPEVGECLAREATAFVRERVTGQMVALETDPTQGERDKYQRMLAYVRIGSGATLGEELLRAGLAREYTYDEPYRYQAVYRAAQDQARSEGVGQWEPGRCAN